MLLELKLFALMLMFVLLHGCGDMSDSTQQHTQPTSQDTLSELPALPHTDSTP
jgi:hypothetical protein